MMRDLAALLFASLVCAAAHAQGGPPMATDDPGTPGDGHWEINLAAAGIHTRDAWNLDVPDADINYGLGEHIQLNLDLPWTYTNSGRRWRAGFGDSSIAVKWRFLDKDDAHAFDLSVYPRYQASLSNYSERIGVASPDRELFVPIEAATKVRGFDIAADLGRHIVQRDADFWSAGIVAGHACGTEKAQCLLEIHREWGGGPAQTLLNLGLRWKVSDALTVLGAAGREFGHTSEDQARAKVYLGLQISR